MHFAGPSCQNACLGTVLTSMSSFVVCTLSFPMLNFMACVDQVSQRKLLEGTLVRRCQSDYSVFQSCLNFVNSKCQVAKISNMSY